MQAGPRQKHLFYTELAKLLQAGFDIRRAAGVMVNTKLPPAQILLLNALNAGLESGESITHAFARNPRSISGLERSMIAAGDCEWNDLPPHRPAPWYLRRNLAGLTLGRAADRVSSESAQAGMIRRAGKRIATVAAEGYPLGPEFIAEKAFPVEFSRSYATGEEAGTLDTNIGNWSRKFQEAAESSMKTASVMVPKVLYFLIVAYIAWHIIGFFSGYYAELENI